MKMKMLTVFVTTGRCGTQWLARHLSELYPREAEVVHEPLGPHYRPRDFFRSYADPREQLDHEPIRAHARHVQDVLRTRSYVETGWPAFAAIPLFIELFAPEVRIVHLVRHPVPTAMSHTVHQCYFGSPRDDDYTRLAALDPSLPGAFQKELRPRWGSMSPFERCLFWWTEVNLYALELRERYPSIPYHFVRSEEMLEGDEKTLSVLLDHLGLPVSDALARRVGRLEDRWHHRTDKELEWRTIRNYPRALELAHAFGYDPVGIDDRSLVGRYRGRPTWGD